MYFLSYIIILVNTYYIFPCKQMYMMHLNNARLKLKISRAFDHQITHAGDFEMYNVRNRQVMF